MNPLCAKHRGMINACMKYRGKFAPFCPGVPFERMGEYFVNSREEPFVITSFAVRPEKRDPIPAVIHVYGAACSQSVRRKVKPEYQPLAGTVLRHDR